MIHLRSVAIRPYAKELANRFPFCVPAIKSLTRLKFSSPVTFLVGENGSGKSTLLEGIGASCSLPIVGSKNFEDDSTLENARQLAEFLKLEWKMRTNRGFYLRAEDFFGFSKKLTRLKAELRKEEEEFDKNLPDGYGKKLARGAVLSQIVELERRYGVDLDARSHGESFLMLFESRLKPGGLYLLDEPETPLSPTRQMSLLILIDRMVKQDCQFIIATHSPVLMSYPEATILDFDSTPIKKTSFDEVENVAVMKGFLENRERYLRELGISSQRS